MYLLLERIRFSVQVLSTQSLPEVLDCVTYAHTFVFGKSQKEMQHTVWVRARWVPKPDLPTPVSSLSHLLCSPPPPSCQSDPLPSSSRSLGTVPRHGPTYGHHSLPQNPSPPTLSKPLANSCTHLACSPPDAWHRTEVQVPDAAPRGSGGCFGHSLQTPGSSSAEGTAYAAVSPAVIVPVLPSQPPRPV